MEQILQHYSKTLRYNRVYKDIYNNKCYKRLLSLPPARLGQPLPAGGTLPPARHAGGGVGGYRGDTLALVHPSPGPLNLLGWGLILSAALSSLGKIWPP